MTAVVTVVFTSCPTRGGQQRNQFTTRVVHLPKRTEISWITEADLITELGPCIAALAGKVSFSSCRTFIRVCQLYCRLKKLQKLLHAVLNLDQSTIAEIRGYNSPPAGIHEVMKATLLVLGFWEEETHVSFENWKILSNKEFAKETKIKPNFNGPNTFGTMKRCSR